MFFWGMMTSPKQVKAPADGAQSTAEQLTAEFRSAGVKTDVPPKGGKAPRKRQSGKTTRSGAGKKRSTKPKQPTQPPEEIVRAKSAVISDGFAFDIRVYRKTAKTFLIDVSLASASCEDAGWHQTYRAANTNTLFSKIEDFEPQPAIDVAVNALSPGRMSAPNYETWKDAWQRMAQRVYADLAGQLLYDLTVREQSGGNQAA